MVRRSPYLILVLLISTCRAMADEIDRVVEQYLKATHTPGMAVAICKNGKIIKSKGYGFSNLELMTKVRPDSVFEIGSVSKMFTAALVLMLVEEGKVSLGDPISKYLDDIPEAWRPATISQCLTHTSGIPDYLARLMNTRLDYTKKQILDGIANAKLDFEFGSSWSYSNTGYYLAGMIIEKVTGEEFADVLSARILKPLKMDNSDFYRPSRLYKNRASGYTATEKRVMPAEVIRPNAGYAAGSIVSTSLDMIKWMEALRSGILLNSESRNVMWSPVRLSTGRTYPYGLGWDVEILRSGHKFYGHGGNTYGYSAYISSYPEEKLEIVTLCNNVGLNNRPLNQKIAEIVAPKLKAESLKAAADPDPTRTLNLRLGLASLLRGVPDATYIDQEFLGMLSSVRGKLMLTNLNASLGQIKSLEFVTQQPSETDWLTWYRCTFEKVDKPVMMKLLVSKDKKIVRLDVDND